MAEEEVEKLLARGAGWLAAHPERELIARRYLRHRRGLVDEALQRLAEAEGAAGRGRRTRRERTRPT